MDMHELSSELLELTQEELESQSAADLMALAYALRRAAELVEAAQRAQRALGGWAQDREAQR